MSNAFQNPETAERFHEGLSELMSSKYGKGVAAADAALILAMTAADLTAQCARPGRGVQAAAANVGLFATVNARVRDVNDDDEVGREATRILLTAIHCIARDEKTKNHIGHLAEILKIQIGD